MGFAAVLLALLVADGYLGPLEREVVAEVNRLRAAPDRFAAHLEQQQRFYRGKLFERPGEVPVATQEGAAAVAEAMRALRAQKPLAPMTPALGLTLAARQHANDLGRSGRVEHAGSDGSAPAQRIARFGAWDGKAGENIATGFKTGRDVVMQLVVDDGVPGRGHRKSLLDPAYARIGVACARHKVYKIVCVLTHASRYTDRSGVSSADVRVWAAPRLGEELTITRLDLESEGDRRWVRLNGSKERLDRDAFRALVRKHPELREQPLTERAERFLAGD